MRRTRRRKSQKMDFQEFWDSCAQNRTSEISKTALSGILGLLCAEQDVGNLKNCTVRHSGTPVRRTRRRNLKKRTFRNSGTPLRRTRRRKSQKHALSGFLGLLCAEQDVGYLKQKHLLEFWDSCAQSKTSEISQNRLSGILGLLCAEQDVGNLENALSGILGLLCAEQNVGNLKKCAFRNSGTLVRGKAQVYSLQGPFRRRDRARA